MKRFFGIALGALLAVCLMALPAAAKEGNENEQEFEHEFEQWHQEFEQEFEIEDEQEFEHELEHIVGRLLIGFGGEFEIRAAGMDDKFIVKTADGLNHWFKVEVEDKDEVPEFETETNTLTIKEVKVNGVVQPFNMKFKLKDDGTLEKIQ